MKALFVGPSLAGSTIDLAGLDVRPPARQGDVLCAVREGVRAIGLIDGEFSQSAAVWHKEILFALSRSIAVFGASSMGALRAAECAAFGMIPVGKIAHSYLDGALNDDAAVALVMLPVSMGSAPTTEPLVDVEATLRSLLFDERIDVGQFERAMARARATHFTQRTVETLFNDEGEARQLLQSYQRHHVSQKRADAELLVRVLRDYVPPSGPTEPNFVLAQSPYWARAFSEAGGPAR